VVGAGKGGEGKGRGERRGKERKGREKGKERGRTGPPPIKSWLWACCLSAR